MILNRAARRSIAARAGLAGLASILLLTSCEEKQEQQAPPERENPNTYNTPVVPNQTINLNPSQKTVSFEAEVGADPAPRQVSIVNRNNEPRRIISRQVTGSAEAFTVSGCDNGIEINATGNCTLTVSTRASIPGAWAATIIINYEKMGEALTINLASTIKAKKLETPPPTPDAAPAPAPVAVAPPPPPPIIYYNPAPIESLAQARSSMRSTLRGQIGAEQLVPTPTPAATSQATFNGMPSSVASLPVDTRFILTRDKFIPAVLYTPVRSDQGGRVTAQVTRHVYGGDGRTILIHAGSSVIGSVGSTSTNRSSTMLFAWEEIITPNGISIPIRGSEGSDAMGRPGVPGELYSRFIERFGMAVLTSIIGNATTYALSSDTPQTTTNSPFGGTSTTQSPRDAAIQKFGEDVSGITRRLIEEASNIRPVLVVAGGTRINIVPATNLYFRRNSNDFAEIVAAENARARNGSGFIDAAAGAFGGSTPAPGGNTAYPSPGGFTPPGGAAPAGVQMPTTLPPPTNNSAARLQGAPPTAGRPNPVGPQTFTP